MDDELKEIERQHRRKVILYGVLGALGMLWAAAKIFSVHVAIVGG